MAAWNFRPYQIDVVRPESLQASLNGHMHALRTGPTKVALLHGSAGHIAKGVLGRNDHLIPASSLLQPFADPLLALTALIDIGRIDEVAAEVVKRVQELKCILLGALAKLGSPVVAQALNTVSLALAIGFETAGTYSCRPSTAG